MSAADSVIPVSVLTRCFSPARLSGYLARCGGDVTAGLGLYQWNNEVSAALWEGLAHFEVALRNTIADRLVSRHHRLGRPGSWLDDPASEFDSKARRDIVTARQRVAIKRKPAGDGQTISELPFGFWRFLLARRYNTTLWPDLATGFAHAPNRDRHAVEAPIERLHDLRNRLAHHERVWTEPLEDRYRDLTDVLGYIDPGLARWVNQLSRVQAVIAVCPITRP
jgi:hypothetical protein